MTIGNTAFGQMEEFAVSINGDHERTFLEVDGKRYPDFQIPFSREEIEAALSDYSPSRMSTDPLSSIGSTLFNALFSEDVGRSFWRRMAEVDRKNCGLRLRILSNLERTQHLPWELLFDPSRSDFLSLSGRVALVRTRPDVRAKNTPLEPLPKLRILAASADVTGTLRTRDELAILQGLASANPSRMELTVLDQVTPGLLEQRLNSDKFDVFHFVGTGEVLPYVSKRGGVRQALRLMPAPALSGQKGATPSTPVPPLNPNEPLMDRQDLGRLLGQSGVRLAVFNACHTDWIARSVAKYIPSTLGLRETFTLESCLTLCESLYQSLLGGVPLDLSVTVARQALDRAHPGTGDWCKIIFYLQQTHGDFLLTRTEESKPVESNTPLGTNKEVIKLSRLLEVYERNLMALERETIRASAVDTVRQQAEELQRRLASVKQQLGEAQARAKNI